MENFIGVVAGILAIGLIALLIISGVWDFNRFHDVSIANTIAEIEEACAEYEMSSLKRIPQKCFPYIEGLNVNIVE